MSISVVCTIKVAEEEYEAGTEDIEIFAENAWAGNAGSFASLPALFIERAIEAATAHAKEQALKRLTAIKGEK